MIAVGNGKRCVQLFRWSNEEFVLVNKLELIKEVKNAAISLSMSPDGDLLVVGDPLNNKVNLYALPSCVLLQTMRGGDNVDNFGGRVLVSEDKSCIVTSSVYHYGSRVDVFRRKEGPADSSYSSSFSSSYSYSYRKTEVVLVHGFMWGVSLSRECDRLVIGESPAPNERGRISVYTLRRDVGWNLVGEIDGEAVLDKFGVSVALSSDGDRVAVGAPFNDVVGTNRGVVGIFAVSGCNNCTTTVRTSVRAKYFIMFDACLHILRLLTGIF